MRLIFAGLMMVFLTTTVSAADAPDLKNIQGQWSGAGRYWILEMKVNGTAVIGTMECNGTGVINFFRGKIVDDSIVVAREDANPVRTIGGKLPDLAIAIGGGACRAETLTMHHRA